MPNSKTVVRLRDVLVLAPTDDGTLTDDIRDILIAVWGEYAATQYGKMTIHAIAHELLATLPDPDYDNDARYHIAEALHGLLDRAGFVPQPGVRVFVRCFRRVIAAVLGWIRKAAKDRRAWAVIGVMTAIVTVVALVTVGRSAFSRHHYQHFSASGTTCTPAAIKQLPKNVVKTVNAAQASYQLSGTDFDDTITSRVVNGWEVDAFIGFEPQYCGFVGNINFRPLSAKASRGVGGPSFTRDSVIVIRNGRLYNSGNKICIGNTPPVARKDNGHIEMTFYCDRVYAAKTWMQTQPDLRQ